MRTRHLQVTRLETSLRRILSARVLFSGKQVFPKRLLVAAFPAIAAALPSVSLPSVTQTQPYLTHMVMPPRGDLCLLRRGATRVCLALDICPGTR